MKQLSTFALILLTFTCTAQFGFPDLTFNPEDPGLGFGRRFNSGPVSYIEQRADGQYLCFGSFSEYNGDQSSSLVLLDNEGERDESFAVDPDIANALFAVDLFEDKLYVVGEVFPVGDGFEPLARLNSDGSLDDLFQLEGAFEPSPEISKVLAMDNGNVFVSGEFETYNGEVVGNLLLFGPEGILIQSFDAGTGFTNNGSPNVPLDLISDEQGRVIACGFFNEYNGEPVEGACRINPDGSLDEAFSANFMLVPPISGSEAVYTAAILDEGKIALGGSFGGTDDFTSGGLLVLNEDGTRDAAFDLPGEGFNVGFSSLNSVRSLAYHPSGAILIGGSFTQLGDSTQTNFTAVNLDGSFNENFAPQRGASGRVNDIAVLSSSEVVYVGDFEYVDYRNNRYIMKLNDQGNPDEEFARGQSFSKPAFVVKPIPGTSDIYVAGSFSHYRGTYRSFLIRLDNTGNLVEEFDTGEGLTGFNSNFAYASRIEVQEDGKVLCAGLFDTFNGSEEIPSFIRLNSDGSLDETFDIEGIGGSSVELAYYDIKVDSQGRIYVGGGMNQWNGQSANNVVRLNPDGSFDETFSTGNGPNGIVESMAIDSQDRLYIVGDFSFYDGENIAQVARLNEDGSIDTDFSPAAISTLQTAIYDIEIYNGNIYVGGEIRLESEPGVEYATLVLDENGDLTTEYTPYEYGNARHMVVDDFGRVVLSNGNAGSLIRLNGDGSEDEDWDSGEGFQMGGVSDLAVNEDNELYAVGSFMSYNGVGRQYITRITNSNVFGTEDNQEQSFSIYPNPSDDQVILDLQTEDLFETLRVYSIDGKVIHERVVIEIPLVMNIHDWTPGTYILSVGNKSMKLIR